MKNPFELLVEVFAALDEVHDHEHMRMIEGIGDPVL